MNTLRSITKKNSKDRPGIEQIKGSLYQRHVYLCNPCALAESRAKTVFGHLKRPDSWVSLTPYKGMGLRLA